MVITVFLLFCTVLSFTWGPKCILCVSTVIYQEFCEILWRVFVLVLLYLVSCIFSTISSLSMFNSLSLSLLILSVSFHFSVPTGFQLLHTVLPGSNKNMEGKGNWYLPTKENTTYYRKKEIKLLKVTDLISACKNFRGKGRLNTRAELSWSCLFKFLSKVYSRKLEGQVPWSPNDMHQEEVKRTWRIVEGQQRSNAGVCEYLCLMGYTDQSGIRLWQQFNTRCVLWYELCSTHQD